MINITPEQLYELSKECLVEYQMDLGDSSISTDDYLKITCLTVLEQFDKLEGSDLEYALLSSVVSLSLENFLLNMRVLKVNKTEQNYEHLTKVPAGEIYNQLQRIKMDLNWLDDTIALTRDQKELWNDINRRVRNLLGYEER